MYNGIRVLDVHGHVSAPDAGLTALTRMMASNTPWRSPIAGNKSSDVPGFTDEDYHRTVDNHVRILDERDIDVQIIGPRPFMMMGWMEDHLFPYWTSYVNDTIAKQVSMYPTRFAGAAALPQNAKAPDLKHVIPELERCVKEYGFIAAYASPDPTGDRDSPGMHEEYWFPLYEYCQANGLPIIVHGTNAKDPRYRVVPANYQLGFYTEQYLATQFLSHGDVFERYPELKVVVCHCGGGLDRFIPSDAHIAQKDLSNNLFFDSCAYDINFLEAAIKQRTPDRMCFGTEAPGSGRAVRPENGVPGDNLVPVISAMEFLSEEDKIKIFNGTPLKVFSAFDKI